MSGGRRKTVLMLGLGGCLALWAGRSDRAPRLLFNTTASAPIGVYWVTPGRFAVGDLVAVRPPPTIAAWMAKRRYLPLNIPLVKMIAAGRGQHVCGKSDGLFVDGRRLARAKRRDHWGRALPVFRDCRDLVDGEILLVNEHAPDSLDSRYFGPISTQGVIGSVSPVWTWGTQP